MHRTNCNELPFDQMHNMAQYRSLSINENTLLNATRESSEGRWAVC